MREEEKIGTERKIKGETEAEQGGNGIARGVGKRERKKWLV